MTVRIDAGLLDQRVTIERYTAARDRGETVKRWQTVATVWAQVLTAGSREHYRASQVHAELSCVVRIRYRADVDPTMRLVHRGRVLEIAGTPEDTESAGVELLIPCRLTQPQV